jgi:hypothetical protein
MSGAYVPQDMQWALLPKEIRIDQKYSSNTKTITLISLDKNGEGTIDVEGVGEMSFKEACERLMDLRNVSAKSYLRASAELFYVYAPAKNDTYVWRKLRYVKETIRKWVRFPAHKSFSTPQAVYIPQVVASTTPRPPPILKVNTPPEKSKRKSAKSDDLVVPVPSKSPPLKRRRRQKKPLNHVKQPVMETATPELKEIIPELKTQVEELEIEQIEPSKESPPQEEELVYAVLPPISVMIPLTKDIVPGDSTILVQSNDYSDDDRDYDWTEQWNEHDLFGAGIDPNTWNVFASLYTLGLYISKELGWPIAETRVTTKYGHPTMMMKNIIRRVYQSFDVESHLLQSSEIVKFVIFCWRSLIDYNEVRPLVLFAASKNPLSLKGLVSSTHSHENCRYALTWPFKVDNDNILIHVDERNVTKLSISSLAKVIFQRKAKFHHMSDLSERNHEILSQIPIWVYDIE